MFNETTRNAICALVAIDKAVTAREREMLTSLLSGRTRKTAVIKYKDAAKRLNLSVPSIKRLVATKKLKAVNSGGSRSMGVTEESLMQFTM